MNDRQANPFDEPRLLFKEGRYDEALIRHIWLHDHVLDDNPSLYGVRLSFALANWIELANKYPKALAVLKDIRNKKSARILAGKLERNLFDDVHAINHYLDE